MLPYVSSMVGPSFSSTVSPTHTLRLGEAAQIRLRNSSYSALREIVCSIHEGMLRLEGRVASYHLKQVAQEVVTDVAGIRGIVNQIVVISASGRSAEELGQPNQAHRNSAQPHIWRGRASLERSRERC